MLMGTSTFLAEAVQYAVHILNRSPTAILGDVRPAEKWCKQKPTVEHLRVFGCVAYVLVPYERGIKLDEKSITCIMFGVSSESKAYPLYDPALKRIIISKDVKFDERWNWEESMVNSNLSWDGMLSDSEEEDHAGEQNTEIVEEEEEVVIQDVETAAETDANDRGDGDGAADNAQEEVAETSTNRQPSREGGGRTKQAPIWMKDCM